MFLTIDNGDACYCILSPLCNYISFLVLCTTPLANDKLPLRAYVSINLTSQTISYCDHLLRLMCETNVSRIAPSVFLYLSETVWVFYYFVSIPLISKPSTAYCTRYGIFCCVFVIIIIIRQPLCPVVGRRPQHVVSKWPCHVLSSAISCRSSICPGRLSTAWLVSLDVFSCHMVSKWWCARSIGRLWGGWYALPRTISFFSQCRLYLWVLLCIMLSLKSVL